MKTFFHLIEEVHKPGPCHHCGGCVTFCTAINYGALELAEGGAPRYKDPAKCIECGLCYCICPEISEMDEGIKQLGSWGPPLGCVRGITLARVTSPVSLSVTVPLPWSVNRGEGQATPFFKSPSSPVATDPVKPVLGTGAYFPLMTGMI